jgi:hypothetical protein
LAARREAERFLDATAMDDGELIADKVCALCRGLRAAF